MKERLTMDTLLKEVLNNPKIVELLQKYGLSRLEEEDILDIVEDKLTLKGFFRLMDLDEDLQGELWRQIQEIYRRSE